ncbi:hypothetical protein DFP72DRAFT_989228 [Ephemerocybe angulata]|uniref:Snurportin-1 n=1 Tax=Ephemerocybe angulata TaxID=980116 RepID=A0A8H6I4G6_9AGAR|nr:hypothetical protein DFP72DRAFT_989228 [Tulosesus angulatus]
MSQDRKSTFKLPPALKRESSVPQEIRRNKALEEQKRRRAQQIESNRQFDLFAHLSINDGSDSDDAPENAVPNSPVTASAALGPYVAMLNEDSQVPQNEEMSSSMVTRDTMDLVPGFAEQVASPAKKKSKKRNKKKSNYNKPSKWADQCMYAELLEMAEEEPSWSSDGEDNDSLPNDLESGWVAVAPVPVGKRCLVVTHQTAGAIGTAANTTVRSRLLGKSLIPRFPSTLPPLTVLDCILDANWRQNGIVHVLDVVRWKGQDIGDCEAPFRFWWRDTRLGELPTRRRGTTTEPATTPQFPYPTYFLPIPYHTNTTLASLETQVIPSARSKRSVVVEVPTEKPPPPEPTSNFISTDLDLSAGVPSSSSFTFTSTLTPSIVMAPSPIVIEPDGLLLYTAEASYEPGTSPLSSWVPITGYATTGFPENPVNQRPLDLFQRLVQRRLHKRQLVGNNASETPDVFMDVEPSA